jgi:manganese/zinc/iron transport system ATP- binding protein
VPQRGSVDWDFPVLDVVTMGTYGSLGWLRRPGRAEHERALRALGKIGAADFRDRQISQLRAANSSKRVPWRALVQRPHLSDGRAVPGVDATTERTIVACCASCARRAERS